MANFTQTSSVGGSYCETVAFQATSYSSFKVLKLQPNYPVDKVVVVVATLEAPEENGDNYIEAISRCNFFTLKANTQKNV